MTLSTKRKIYYTSVITALVAILVSAVVINRTFINTPEVDFEKISPDAGECISIYMAYVNENEEVKVGVAEENEQIFADVQSFVKSVPLYILGEDDELPKNKKLSAWVVMYDADNRIVSRMNFYNGGEDMWYDGRIYKGSVENMNRLIEFCNSASAK